MSLPKIQFPTYDLIVPSTKQKIKFRPFLVKEEKILLMAGQSQSEAEIVNSLNQIVTNCVITKPFDVEKLAAFDIEYIFIKIRAKSVNNVIQLEYSDKEDDKNYQVEINLDEIEVVFPENISNRIQINDELTMTLKWPSFSVLGEMTKQEKPEDQLFLLIRRCIDKLIYQDEVFDLNDSTPEEINEFIDSIDSKTFAKIKSFIENIPSPKHTVSYTNSLGTKREIVLEKLTDFFTFA